MIKSIEVRILQLGPPVPVPKAYDLTHYSLPFTPGLLPLPSPHPFAQMCVVRVQLESHVLKENPEY